MTQQKDHYKTKYCVQYVYRQELSVFLMFLMF